MTLYQLVCCDLVLYVHRLTVCFIDEDGLLTSAIEDDLHNESNESETLPKTASAINSKSIQPSPNSLSDLGIMMRILLRKDLAIERVRRQQKQPHEQQQCDDVVWGCAAARSVVESVKEGRMTESEALFW